MKDKIFFELVNVTSFYEEKKILDSINLSIKKGDFVVVFGANGSGKSTLAKHLNGLFLPNIGDVIVDSYNTKDKEKYYDIKQKISFVFQNPEHQIVADKVKDDIAFGPENLGIMPDEINRRIDISLELVSLYEKKNDYIDNLSGGGKQRLTIASSLALGSEAIILDEPTSMLDAENKENVIKTLLGLNQQKNITIVLFTHHIEELLLGNRIIMLEKGKVIFDDDKISFFEKSPILNKNLLCKLKDKSTYKDVEKNKILEIKNIYFKYTNSEKFILNDINVSFNEGEIVGIKGKSGSGKTTLINILKGIIKPTKGEILFKNEKINSLSNPLNKKIGLAFQYPENQIFEDTVLNDVMFGPKNLGFKKEECIKLAKFSLESLGIEEDEFDRSPIKLSGGKIRKVAIAGIISMNPEVLILDEPTSGLDFHSRQMFLDLILNLNKKTKNLTIIISHLYEDLKQICDRIFEIKNFGINEID